MSTYRSQQPEPVPDSPNSPPSRDFAFALLAYHKQYLAQDSAHEDNLALLLFCLRDIRIE